MKILKQAIKRLKPANKRRVERLKLFINSTGSVPTNPAGINENIRNLVTLSYIVCGYMENVNSALPACSCTIFAFPHTDKLHLYYHKQN